MPALKSKLNPRSEEFKASAEQMRALVDDLNAKLALMAAGGGEVPRAKHTARGKLPPRERVEMLLDPDTPFLEIAPLAALDMYDNAAPGAGMICGVGRVSGVECLRRIQSNELPIRVIVLSMYPEDQLALHLLREGAAAYLSKDRQPTELLLAIRKVATGERYMTDTLAS